MTTYATTVRTVIVHPETEHPINGNTLSTLVSLDGDEQGNVVRLQQAENVVSLEREDLEAVYAAAMKLLDDADWWVTP